MIFADVINIRKMFYVVNQKFEGKQEQSQTKTDDVSIYFNTTLLREKCSPFPRSGDRNSYWNAKGKSESTRFIHVSFKVFQLKKRA